MYIPERLRAAFNLGGLTAREVAVRTYFRMLEHEIMTRAAAVSFYAMLALVPFLGLVLFLTVQILPDIEAQAMRSRYGQESAGGVGSMTTEELRITLRSVFPAEAYSVIENQIARLQKPNSTNYSFLVFGFAITLWLASSLYVAVIDALNRIGGVSESRSYLKIYSTALSMTFIEAIILVGSLLAIVLWPQILSYLGLSFGGSIVATVAQWLAVFFLVLLSFALTFYVAPDSNQRWEWISPGSLLGTVVFLAASFGFRIYVQHFSNYDKTYGSLGGVMVLLFWFWISSLVMLTSAQFNQVIEEASPLGKTHGQKVDITDPPDFKAMVPEPSTT